MTEIVTTYIERNVTGTWSDMSSFVVGDIVGEYLTSKPDANSMLASSGRLEMVVDNESGNFSPNQYFQRGTPVRVRTVYDGVSKTKFQGKILYLDPDTLEWGDQYVRVTVNDWLRDAVEYPVILPQLQQDIRANQAVSYLLSLMTTQPESVIYHAGREVFEFCFDTVQKNTRAYNELSKIALSEYGHIYMRAGNILVVESANTRHGQRELTQIPVRPSDSAALLTSPNGYLLLTANGIPILADQVFTPNLASGTHQPMDVEIENGEALANFVTITAFPSRVDETPVKLFQLDKNRNIAAMSTFKVVGTYANPNGGGPINVLSVVTPMVTGTNYRFTNADDTEDRSTQLIITEAYGTNRFRHFVLNNGKQGVLRQFDIYGYGIYPYNPEEVNTGITGSIAQHGLRELRFDQKYQEDTNVSQALADMIADDEKDPRNRLLSVTFDASGSPQHMQASQYMDTGDLTHITNVKPPLDVYAYLRGKRFVITPAGVVTEQWYLKETYTLRNGLSPIAMNYSGVSGSMNAISAPLVTHLNNLTQKTYMSWVHLKGSPSALGHVLMSKCTEFSGDVFWLSYLGQTGKIQYSGLFSTPGTWRTTNDVVSNLTGTWAHIAVTMDASSPLNDPIFYVNGVSVPITEIDTPAGSLVDDSDALLMIGNFATRPSDNLGYALNALTKDTRVYNRVCSPDEVLTIAANPNNYFTVPRGLVFQGMAVKTEELSDYVGQPIVSTMFLIDNMFGVRCPATYNTTQASYQLKGADPSLSSYP